MERKRSNEKITRNKISFSTSKMSFFFFFLLLFELVYKTWPSIIWTHNSPDITYTLGQVLTILLCPDATPRWSLFTTGGDNNLFWMFPNYLMAFPSTYADPKFQLLSTMVGLSPLERHHVKSLPTHDRKWNKKSIHHRYIHSQKKLSAVYISWLKSTRVSTLQL
jgi:hypothetical protein